MSRLASTSLDARTSRERNHIILRLRGMYATFSVLSINNDLVFTQDQISQGQALIDDALESLGAEPESARKLRFATEIASGNFELKPNNKGYYKTTKPQPKTRRPRARAKKT